MAETAIGLGQGVFEAWLRAHPDAVLITDFKRRNVEGLAAIAPDLRARILPQIYSPDELAPVRRLGFDRVIFTAYRSPLTDDQLDALATALRRQAQRLARLRAAIGTKAVLTVVKRGYRLAVG